MHNFNGDYYTTLKKQLNKNESESIIEVNPFYVVFGIEGSRVNLVDYTKIEKADLGAKKVGLVNMHAGLGTSLDRIDHLKKYSKIGTEIGSKGTDLYFNCGEFGNISIMEAQFQQIVKASSYFKSAHIIPAVSDKTLAKTEKTLALNCPFENDRTWGQYLKSKNVIVEQPIVQEYQECLNLDGSSYRAKSAPAGHAFFIYSIINHILVGTYDHLDAIIIRNGEDLSQSLNEKMFSHILNSEEPLSMILTERTKKDRKGGVLAIARKEGSDCPILFEKAQAEEAGLLEQFYNWGIDGDDTAMFNTNIVMININNLKKYLASYIEKYGIKDLKEAIAPDLILNKKNNEGHDYYQLEGATGSLVLNMNEVFLKKMDMAISSFVFVPENLREEAFFPIKTEQDFESYFNSDEIKFDTQSFVLKK